MSNGAYEGRQELSDRLAVIAVAMENFVGVNRVEHLLVDLLLFLKSDRIGREDAAGSLIALVEPWPGAPEVIEFTMRDLQWPEVRHALEAHVSSDADFRTRDMASSVLEVYEERWPAGEIYRTYRSG